MKIATHGFDFDFTIRGKSRKKGVFSWARDRFNNMSSSLFKQVWNTPFIQTFKHSSIEGFSFKRSNIYILNFWSIQTVMHWSFQLSTSNIQTVKLTTPQTFNSNIKAFQLFKQTFKHWTFQLFKLSNIQALKFSTLNAQTSKHWSFRTLKQWSIQTVAKIYWSCSLSIWIIECLTVWRHECLNIWLFECLDVGIISSTKKDFYVFP